MGVIMEAPEVANYVLKVIDTMLRENQHYTGKIEIIINCNSGGIGSVTAQEKRKIELEMNNSAVDLARRHQMFQVI